MHVTEIELLLERTNALKGFDFSAADTVLRNTVSIARNLFGVESHHVAELMYVRFTPIGVIYNTGHYMNDVHWEEGTERLRRVLSAMLYELKLLNNTDKLLPPEVITVKWLIQHVSIAYWFSAGGILIAAFGFGFFVASNNLVTKIVTFVKSLPTP